MAGKKESPDSTRTGLLRMQSSEIQQESSGGSLSVSGGCRPED